MGVSYRSFMCVYRLLLGLYYLLTVVATIAIIGLCFSCVREYLAQHSPIVMGMSSKDKIAGIELEWTMIAFFLVEAGVLTLIRRILSCVLRDIMNHSSLRKGFSISFFVIEAVVFSCFGVCAVVKWNPLQLCCVLFIGLITIVFSCIFYAMLHRGEENVE